MSRQSKGRALIQQEDGHIAPQEIDAGAGLVGVKRMHVRERKFLTEAEVSRLIAAVDASRYPERDRCLIFWAYRRGLRVSELVDLRLTDLDLVARVVYIRRRKGGTPATHPINPEELGSLRKWLKKREAMRGADTDFVFLTERGGPFSRSNFNKLLIRYYREAGLMVRPSPHMLRHACGYELANRGHDTRAIQTYLGHRDIKSTAIYTETNPERFKRFWES